MPYICILISLVFENVIGRYINTQGVLQFILVYLFTVFNRYLLSSCYRPGTVGRQ